MFCSILAFSSPETTTSHSEDTVASNEMKDILYRDFATVHTSCGVDGMIMLNGNETMGELAEMARDIETMACG